MEFKPIKQLVPKVFPAIGTTLFAAREKSGKSLMMTDLCMAVTHGGSFMGNVMEEGDALYIALEDKPQRLGQRCKSLGYQSFHHTLCVAHTWPLIGVKDIGGYDCVSKIQTWYDYVKRNGRIPRLAAIDTLNFVRPHIGKGQNPYAKDCSDIKALTDLANKLNLAIILVHHNNKIRDLDNPNDKMSGTTGLPASVDNVVVLYEVQGRQILSVKSRDMESGKYSVDFDPATLKWSFNGSYEVPPKQNIKTKIVEFLSANGASTPKAIAEGIGYGGNISVLLKQLNDKRQTEKREDGLYQIMEAA